MLAFYFKLTPPQLTTIEDFENPRAVWHYIVIHGVRTPIIEMTEEQSKEAELTTEQIYKP